ncbi:MAG: 16S rRNA (uracil(1498)-N(3))-methyltransferase [Pyrinomonadaceae bacterium]|nr:16S rRNA (uracil(1498)-N(3))-methyltransferase [Pyrinomonadaceae bacterium]
MTRRRFYAPPSAFSPELGSVTLASDEARHLRDVLRLQPGDEVYVFNGAGKEFHCQVERSERNAVQLKVLGPTEPARPESPLRLTLAVALLKGEKFDLVVQKVTELGVARVIPVVTKHADIRLRDASDAAKRVARWQRIAIEAAKQSGRAAVPEVTNPVIFESLVQTVKAESEGASQGLMFSERDGEPLLAAGRNLRAQPSSLTALIGSEGGWADEEIAFARAAGWSVVTLGGRTLRAETAAIAATTLLQHKYGDLS